MKSLLECFSALANKLPDFMIGYLLELMGVLLASIFVAIFSILFIDKKKEIQKVKARVLDLRLEQYGDIRAFVATQRKISAFPENIENVKYNLELSGLYLEGNENHYSSLGLATEQNINKSLAE